MHRRPFAPDQCAAADRDDCTKPGHHTLLERNAPATENSRFHHIGNAMRPRAGLKKAHQKTNRKTTQNRHQDDLPPRQMRHRRNQKIAVGGKAEPLHQGDKLTESDTAIGGGNADQQGQRRKDKLLAADQTAQPCFKGKLLV